MLYVAVASVFPNTLEDAPNRSITNPDDLATKEVKGTTMVLCTASILKAIINTRREAPKAMYSLNMDFRTCFFDLNLVIIEPIFIALIV